MAKVRKQPTKKTKAPPKKAKAKAKANKTQVRKVTKAKAKTTARKPAPSKKTQARKPAPSKKAKPTPAPRAKAKKPAARPKKRTPPPPPPPRATRPKPPPPPPKATAGLGRFVWHDLMTTDDDAALTFYGRLLGWKFEALDAEGTIAHVIRVGDVKVGAIMPEKGLPTSHWIPYVSVADVEAACRQVTRLGGNVGLSAIDVPEFGRFAVANDPTGALFSPVTRADDGEAGDARGRMGAFVWDELVTSDPEAAVEFYRALFGWTIERVPQLEPPYWVARDAASEVCGLMPFAAAEGASEERPLWLAYLAVDDVDVSTREAVELGGALLGVPRDIPGIGRFSVVADPTGARFALFKPLPRAG